MGKTSQQKPKSKVWQIVRSAVFALIASSLVFYLLNPRGPISSILHADMSSLVIPLISYFILRLLSQLSGSLIRSRRGALAAHILNGVAFSLLSFFILTQAALLTRIPGFAGYRWLSGMSGIIPYVLLFIASYTGGRVLTIIAEQSQRRLAYFAGNALAQLLIGYSLWQSLAHLSDSWAPIGMVILVGMIVVAASNLAILGEKTENPFITDACHWLRQSKPRKFLIGAGIAAYVVFIRPAIIRIFPFSPIIEWVIVCLVAWRLLAGVRSGLRIRHSVLDKESEWRKHVQKISRLADEHFIYLGEVQQRFLEKGDRDNLLVYLTILLDKNRLPQEEISRILHLLFNYHDRSLPWFAFGWEQKRILKQNQLKRQRLLDKVMEDIKTIADPSYGKIKEQINEGSKST